MSLGPNDYVALVGASPGDLDEAERILPGGAPQDRLVARVKTGFLAVFLPETSRLSVTESLDHRTVLIGELQRTGDSAPLSQAERKAALSAVRTKRDCPDWLGRFWGRYVLIRQSAEGGIVLRDPSGALEAVAWSRRSGFVVTSAAVPAVRPLLPQTLAIDEDVLARWVEAPGEFHHEPATTGVEAVAAGGVCVFADGRARMHQSWRPAEVYRRFVQDAASPDTLRERIETAVVGTAGRRSRLLAELSGGLDSAIVAAALGSDGRRSVLTGINRFTRDPPGDERAYARAVAAALELPLHEEERQGFKLCEAMFVPAEGAFRPAFNDLDAEYNRTMAERVDRDEADGILTGQGGDAVFFQMMSPLVGLDEWRERGLGARRGIFVDIARARRLSIWPRTWLGAHRAFSRRPPEPAHPWLDDLDDIPPAKTAQIAALAFSQLFQQSSRRSRRVPCLNPLLSQPAMEAGLAVSTTELTRGGRERGLARRAFADKLPPLLIERRGKGDLSRFYGKVVAADIAFIRAYLGDGLLTKRGLIDVASLDDLSEEGLLWRGGESRWLALCFMEGWLRHWTEILESRRGAESDRTSRSPPHTSRAGSRG